MKGHHHLPYNRKSRPSARVGLLLFAAALACFLATGNAVLGQSKEDLCGNNQARLTELEKQAKTLELELSYTGSTENRGRQMLSTFNKAIIDPQLRERYRAVLLNTPADRMLLAEKFGVPWKDEYLEDKGLVPLLRALRDAQNQRVERIKYVLTNKGEIQQQKADTDRQIAYHRSRLAELGCGESSSSCDALPGTWTWSWGSGNDTKGKEETIIIIAKSGDHTMTQPGNAGTWTCGAGKVTFNWKHSKDTLTIVDKDTLGGESNYGDWVKAKRKQ